MACPFHPFEPARHCQACAIPICARCNPSGVCPMCVVVRAKPRAGYEPLRGPTTVVSIKHRDQLRRKLRSSELEDDVGVFDDPPDFLSGTRSKRRVLIEEKTPIRVARRLVNVHVQTAPQYFGFVYGLEEIDQTPEGASVVRIDVESIGQEWFHRIWNDDLLPLGADRLLQLYSQSKSGRFNDEYFQLAYPDRLLLYDLHRAFCDRTMDPADPAPVAVTEINVLYDDWYERFLQGSHWYHFELRPPRNGPAQFQDLDAADLPDHHAVHAELAMDANHDPPPLVREMRGFGFHPLDDFVLKALHLPQWKPPPPPSGSMLMPSSSSPGSSTSSSTDDTMDETEFRTTLGPEPVADLPARPVYEQVGPWLRHEGSRVLEWLERWLGGPPGLPAGLVPAGVPWPFDLPAGSDEPSTHERGGPRSRYHGRPFVGGGVAPQVANPMLPALAPAHQQPFVAVLNIGQGNMNALYDNTGKIVAYYDFGFPKPSEQKTAPTLQYAPCLHDDPLIVLSHWDWDHYSMARRVRDSWDMRWIAPQQHIGSVATREVYGRVVASASGEMHAWPAHPAGGALHEHLRLPWGYLERGITDDQAGDSGEDLNDGGLVMYACVEDPGGMPPLATPNVAAPLNARPGPNPPLVDAKAHGDAAAVAADAIHLEALTDAVANFAERATAGYAPTGIPTAHVVAAAAAGCGTAAGTGGGWQRVIASMAQANVGLVCQAAVVLQAHLAPGAASAAAAVAALGPWVLPFAVAGGPITGQAFAIAAAIADAAPAGVPLAAAVALPGGLPGLCQAAVHAVVTHFVGGAVAVGPLAAAAPPTTAAVLGLGLDVHLHEAAKVAGSSGAEATIHAGHVPALPAASVARACAIGVGRIAAIGAIGGAGTWQQVLAALVLGPAGGNPVLAGAGTLNGLLGAPGPTMAATVAASPAPGFAGAAGNVEAVAAAAAACEVAVVSRTSANAVAARGGMMGVQDAQARALAGRGAAPLPWNGGAAAIDNAAIDASVAKGDPIQHKEVHAAGRSAAREVALKMGGGSMPAEAAPLVPAPGVAAFGFAGTPSIAAILGAGMGGATPLANIQGGRGPSAANERFLLLTGDVGPNCIPTQLSVVATWPVVVGFTPSHHGAYTCLPDYRSRSHLPWAPGSAAANAGAAAHAVAAAGGNLDVQTAAACGGYCGQEVALGAGLPTLSSLIAFGSLQQAALTCSAAVGNWLVCVTALRAHAPAGRRINAIAAGLATLPGAAASIHAQVAGAAGATAPAIALAIATARVEAFMGGPGALAVHHVAAGAANLAPGGPVMPALGGGAGPMAAAMAAAIDQAVQDIGTSIHPAGGAAFAAMFAACSVAAIPVGPLELRQAVVALAATATLVDADRSLAGAAGRLVTAADAHATAVAVVADAIALGAPVPPLAAPLQVWPGTGAGLPWAECTDVMVACIDTLTAAADSFLNTGDPDDAFAANNGRAGAAAVADLPTSTVVAYSYGVRAEAGQYRHYFGAAGYRHPHPWAVLEYVGRGWTTRRNTSVDAWHSHQPDPHVAGAFVSGGHIALGWSSVNHAPVAGAIDRVCSVCGTQHLVF